MAQGDVNLTVVGNLTADPELRFTPSGDAVANFTIASTSRKFDKESNGWKDGDTVFLRASVWRQYAENVAESLTKGTRVIASGRLKVREYEARDGSKGTSVELEVEDIGPVLRFATAKVNRTERGGGGGGSFGGGQSGGGGQSYGGQSGSQPADSWGGAPQSAPASDEPPF
jgi:single-strand DNA-binding protein